jgi:uncharacterized protein YciI
MKKLCVCVFAFLSIFFQGYSQYTFVFLHKKSDSGQLPQDQLETLMAGHMENMKRLAKENKLLAAGPFGGGGGLFVLNTQKPEDAKEWLSTDPGIQANRWNVEMLPYKPRFGGICPVGENYEMTNYTFIRFIPVVSKFNASNFPEILKKHDDYLKQLSKNSDVVTEAAFGENEGGILIMKGEATQETFESDPGVAEGLLQLDIKKLFIAKGSFCEK